MTQALFDMTFNNTYVIGFKKYLPNYQDYVAIAKYAQQERIEQEKGATSVMLLIPVHVPTKSVTLKKDCQ